MNANAERKEKAVRIAALLDQHYPVDKCFLDYEKPWQLLVSTILSAQCTDAQVNRVTADLFVKYESAAALAGADPAELEQDIRTTGFFHVKAKHIIAACRILAERHNGEAPPEMEALLALPGVGRKTANLLRGEAYGIPGVVVDTHVKRISKKLGLTAHDDPEKIEYDLMACLPEAHWIRYNHQIIAHGRGVCKARKPDCGGCALASECVWEGRKESEVV